MGVPLLRSHAGWSAHHYFYDLLLMRQWLVKIDAIHRIIKGANVKLPPPEPPVPLGCVLSLFEALNVNLSLSKVSPITI